MLDDFAVHPARHRDRTDDRPAILAHVHGYPPVHNAGAEHMLNAILSHLVSAGWRARVVVPQRGYAETGTFDGVSVHADADRATIANCYRDTDLVVTHLNNATSAVLMARRYRRKSVLLLHNDFLPVARLPRADLRVFNSSWMADRYDAPGVVCRPPVRYDDYAGMPGDRVSLLNLYTAKGAGVFWALARRMPDVLFLAVRGSYGPQMIPRHVPPNVEVIANTPDVVRDVYARTRVLLMPSTYESWGRCAVEASCSGIPVVASPTRGLCEALGDAGTFVDPRDLTGWENAVRHLLDDPRAYRSRSMLGRARARELDAASKADLDALDGHLRRMVKR